MNTFSFECFLRSSDLQPWRSMGSTAFNSTSMWLSQSCRLSMVQWKSWLCTSAASSSLRQTSASAEMCSKRWATDCIFDERSTSSANCRFMRATSARRDSICICSSFTNTHSPNSSLYTIFLEWFIATTATAHAYYSLHTFAFITTLIITLTTACTPLPSSPFSSSLLIQLAHLCLYHHSHHHAYYSLHTFAFITTLIILLSSTPGQNSSCT